MNFSFLVEEDKGKQRIDKYISEKTELKVSRSYVSKLIEDGNIRLNGKVPKGSEKIKGGDQVEVLLPEPEKLEIVAEDIPLDIVYEDEDILIVNKGKGMVVHPAAGHDSGTLVNAIMYHCGERLSSINGVLRPGIVHRIDRDTTGLLVVCKNDESHRSLAEQLKVHSITRKYVAILHGNLKEDTGTVEKPIGRHKLDRKKQGIDLANGKDAVTHYRVLKRFGEFTLVECQLETGRTHQIRVHMASIGHPVLGDSVYGPKKCPFKLEGQCLHAKTLGFIHPRTGEYVEFDSEYPIYFSDLLRKIER